MENRNNKNSILINKRQTGYYKLWDIIWDVDLKREKIWRENGGNFEVKRNSFPPLGES